MMWLTLIYQYMAYLYLSNYGLREIIQVVVSVSTDDYLIENIST